jgi:hypothetical protein
MTLSLRIVLIAALSASCCLAQTGTVTFYSGGISAKSEAAVFLPKSQQPFDGWLSDGPQRLAHFHHGRFATFHLSPGAHSFTVLGFYGPGKTPLAINVNDGGQYCIRLSAKVINLIGVYTRWDDQIVEVPCQQAESEGAHLKPIEIKQVDPAARCELDPRTTFPSESQSRH